MESRQRYPTGLGEHCSIPVSSFSFILFQLILPKQLECYITFMFQSLNVTQEEKESYMVSCITHSDPVAGHKLITSYALTGKDAGAKGLHVSECSTCGVMGQVSGLGLSLIPSSPCFCFALNFSCCFRCLLPAGSPRLCRFPSPPQLCLLGYS